MFGVLIPVPDQFGYPLLAALVFGECAGLPIPGETALIVASGLAASGHLDLSLVIAIAAGAAICGDTLGYWLGRRFGRGLLLRGGIGAAHRRNAIARADRYFARFGLATVFCARWLPGVRVVGAIMAGATHMSWPRFAIANSLGAIAWATTVGVIAEAAGETVSTTFAIIGLTLGAVAIVVAAWRERRRRVEPVGS